MSQERNVRPITQKDWKVINTTPVSQHPSLDQFGEILSPADALRYRSIQAEFIITDKKNVHSYHAINPIDLGNHQLLSQQRNARHRLFDSEVTKGTQDDQERYRNRIKLISQELGLGENFIVFEHPKPTVAGNVPEVLDDYDNGMDWADDSPLLNKYNRERTKMNKSNRAKVTSK